MRVAIPIVVDLPCPHCRQKCSFAVVVSEPSRETRRSTPDAVAEYDAEVRAKECRCKWSTATGRNMLRAAQEEVAYSLALIVSDTMTPGGGIVRASR